MAYTDAELEGGLAAWQGRQRASAGLLPFGGGGAGSIDLEVLRRYLSTDGATSQNLRQKLATLQAAGDPRLAQTARALLSDEAAMSNLSDLYSAQEQRQAYDQGYDQSFEASANSGLNYFGNKVDPSLTPTTTREVDTSQVGAADSLDANFRGALGELRDTAARNPYDIATEAGRSNFDRLLAAQRSQQLVQGLGYERGIQGDAASRGMLQAGTTGAKMAAAEGAMAAGLVNREAELGGKFLDASTGYQQRVGDQILNLQTSTAPINTRMQALENVRGGLEREQTRAQTQTNLQDTQDAAGWENVAKGVGTVVGGVAGGLAFGPGGVLPGVSAGQALGGAAAAGLGKLNDMLKPKPAEEGTPWPPTQGNPNSGPNWKGDAPTAKPSYSLSSVQPPKPKGNGFGWSGAQRRA